MPTCNGTITTCDPTPNSPCEPCESECREILSSNCMLYNGVPLSNIDIVTGDTLNEVLEALNTSVDPCLFDIVNAVTQYNNGAAPCGVFILKQNLGSANNLMLGFGANSKQNAFDIDNTFLGIYTNPIASGTWYNTGVGRNALRDQSGGYYNTAIGYNAQLKMSSGSQNTTIGGEGMSVNVCTSTASTGLGFRALYKNTTGDRNTACGAFALTLNTTGTFNTACGESSGNDIITGSYNSILGAATESSIGGTESGNLILGYNVNFSGLSNVCIMGAGNAQSYLTDFYFGTGYKTTAALIRDVSLHSTGATETDQAAANFTIATGQANGNATTGSDFIIQTPDVGASGVTPQTLTTKFTVKKSGSIVIPSTIDTTAGDSATIDKVHGRFRKDTSGATFTLTNSYITANSIIHLTSCQIDATATGWGVAAGSGSAVITFNAAPTGNFDMNFLVIN